MQTGVKIWILCSSGKKHISLMSTFISISRMKLRVEVGVDKNQQLQLSDRNFYKIAIEIL